MKWDKFENRIAEVLVFVFGEMRKEKRAMDIQAYIELVFFNVIFKLCFDEMFAPNDEEFLMVSSALNNINENLGNGLLEDAFSSLRYCPTSRFRRCNRYVDDLLKFVHKRIAQHRATFSPAFRNVRLYEKLMEMEKIYGPIMTLDMGPTRFVILNRLDVIQEAFMKKGAEFAGRPLMPSFEHLTEGYKDILLADYGPSWQLHRKLGLKALAYYMKGEKFEKRITEVLEFVMGEMRKEKEAIDMQVYVELIFFNVICKLCFDEMFERNDEEFLRVFSALNCINEGLSDGFLEDIIPFLRFCPTPRFRRLNRMVDDLLIFVHKRITEQRVTFSPDVQRDFTDAILLAQAEAVAEENPKLLVEITDTHFDQTVMDIIQAGIDTSRITLHWTILYIAAFPEIQAKIHQEVDAALGDRRTPMMSDRSNLRYTEAVLYESMRLATIAPLSVPHTTTCDTTLGDYEIPKGTAIMANLWAVHHDPRLWEEPDKFKPERFLDASGTKALKLEAWMPFSIGKRACMAESVAKPQLHLVLVGIMRNFEIHIPEGVTADIVPQQMGSVCLPKPYKVVVRDKFK